jgi:hypothetical protein
MLPKVQQMADFFAVSSSGLCMISLPADAGLIDLCPFSARACSAVSRKQKVLAYVKFLVDGGFPDQCIMQLPAGDVAAKLIGWMRDHFDDAITTLRLCNP